MKTAVVKDEDGNTCTTAKAQHERWRSHFTKILNIQNDFDVEELRKVRQRPPRPELAEVPSEEELLSAVGKMKNGKAGGEPRILPEMVKAACCDEEFLSKLLELVKTFGRTVVPQVLGVTPSLCLYPTKATSLSVTTGESSRCWMWWKGGSKDAAGEVPETG